MHLSRNGYISLEDYMSFMISRETENVGSMTEVDSAFQAITSGGDKPFVTREELLAVRRTASQAICNGKMLVSQARLSLSLLPQRESGLRD